MNLRRLASIVQKEMRQLRRDKELLGLFIFAVGKKFCGGP